MAEPEAKTRSIPSLTRKVGRIMLTAISVVLACILILVGALLVISRGKPNPILAANGGPLEGSISEKIYVDINGVKQGMILQSRDPKNPVLLILHGGMPEYILTEKYPTGLENDFTVVWWEQRGAGISYSPDIPKESITQEQLIADTLAVTQYLRQRFGKEKIYLLGHSGGTFIGIQAAAQAPELYSAYIGESQMVSQRKSEKMAYDYMLQQVKANGNTAMARKLEAAPVTLENGTPDAYLRVRDDAMHSLGVGTTHDMKSIVSGLFLPSWFSRQYTFMEKLNTWRGKAQGGVSILFKTMQATDLSQQVTELTIPVYFLTGVYDYTCVYDLAKEYFGKIKAPVKGFYTFEQSAHSPINEEPAKSQKIFRENILAGTNSLADIK
jgi:pimeloyl-ACP methyl ester carboxylesterase